MSQLLLPRAATHISSRSPLLTSPRIIAASSLRFFPRVPTTQCPHSNTRTFSVQTRKAKKKAAKAHALTDPPSAFLKTGPPTPKEEAYDVSGLEKEVLKAIEELTHKLSQLRSGGRLNPEVVEGLKVHLGIAGKDGDGKETVRLGDIAQVVPRGRMLNVICGEAEHIKPVSTAIAASPHSLTPLTPEQANPLTIQVPLPPPTGETRRAVIEKASQAAEQADKRIQKTRQHHNQMLRKYQLDRSVLPDDLQKARERMEDVVKKGHTEVKKIADGAKKVLEAQ